MKRLVFTILLSGLYSICYAQLKLDPYNHPIQYDNLSMNNIIENVHYIKSTAGQKYIFSQTKQYIYNKKESKYELSINDSLVYNIDGLLLQVYSLGASSGTGFKNVIFYDENKFKTKIETYDWYNGMWNDYAIKTYVNNSRGDFVSYKAEYFYPDTGWVEMQKRTRIYDETGHLLEEHNFQKSDTLLSAPLLEKSRNFYTYNSAGKLTSQSYDFYYNGTWEKANYYEWIYDENNMITDSIYKYNWVGSNWSSVYMTKYTRTNTGKPITEVLTLLQGTERITIDSMHYTYDDSGNLILKYRKYNQGYYTQTIKYSYNDAGLVDSVLTENRNVYYVESRSLITFDYTNSGKLSERTNVNWADSLSAWVPEQKIKYYYDENDNCAKIEYQTYDGSSWNLAKGNDELSLPGFPQLMLYGAYAEIGYTLVNEAIFAKEEGSIIPDMFVLDQNYPNPFNPETKISFSLPRSGKTSLKIYDMLGREVAELVNAEMEKGPHSVNFNGRNLSSGVYIYRLQSGNFTESKKMMLIK